MQGGGDDRADQSKTQHDQPCGIIAECADYFRRCTANQHARSDQGRRDAKHAINVCGFDKNCGADTKEKPTHDCHREGIAQQTDEP